MLDNVLENWGLFNLAELLLGSFNSQKDCAEKTLDSFQISTAKPHYHEEKCGFAPSQTAK